MITGKYVSIEHIIQAVYDDYGFTLDKYIAAERIWRVIGLINIPYGLETKFTNPGLSVEEYKTPIPLDCYEIEDIKHNKTGISLKPASGIHHINKLIEKQNNNTQLRIEGQNVIFNSEETNVEPTVFVSGMIEQISEESLVYMVQGDTIFYGFPNGEVTIAFKSFPLDQYGYPKVPDDEKYIRAVVIYLAYRHITKLYYSGNAPRELYQEIKSDYVFAAGAISTHSKMPNVATMEHIKQLHTRLNPLYTYAQHAFTTFNNTIYNT